MTDTDTQAPEREGRAGRAMAALTVVALAVAVAVLLIDQQIKRDIITQALAARRLLDEAQKLAEGAAGGLRPDSQRTPDSGGRDGADSVDGGAAVAAEASHDDRNGSGLPRRRKAAPRSRASRDGDGA